jgi:hypothetical protein
MSRKLFGSLATLAALAGVLTFGSALRAQKTTPSILPGSNQGSKLVLPLKLEGGKKVAVLDRDWKIGDCVMLQGARVEFRNDGTVRFTGATYTTAIKFKPFPGRSGIGEDVWHLFFQPLDASGKEVPVPLVGRFRLPEKGDLSDSPTPVDITLRYDASKFQSMVKVRWIGRC